jgi:hypothetical protein
VPISDEAAALAARLSIATLAESEL